MASSSQAAFKLLWEELVRGGMDPNQAAAEALKRFRQQSTTNTKEVSNNTNSVPTPLAPSTTTSKTSTSPKNVPTTTTATTTSSSSKDLTSKRPPPTSSTTRPSKTPKPITSKRVMSLSLNDVEQTYQQSQTDNEPKLMIRMAGTFFADEAILNNSFINVNIDLTTSTEIATNTNPGIDFDGLFKAYNMMTSHKSVANSLINANARMLDSLKSRVVANPSLLSTPSSIRFVLIVLENPLLSEPSNTHVTRRLCKVISNLSTQAREILVSWFVHIGPNRCRTYIKKMHQYITLSIYMEEGDNSIMDVIITLGLIHEASLLHEKNMALNGKTVGDVDENVNNENGKSNAKSNEKSNEKSNDGAKETSAMKNDTNQSDENEILIHYKEFFNDAVNDVVDLDQDFDKWYHDRKRNGTNRRRLRSISDSGNNNGNGGQSSSSSSTTTGDGATAVSSTSSSTSSGETKKNEASTTTVWSSPTKLKNSNASFCACNYVLDTASKAKMLRYDAVSLNIIYYIPF